jgi:hypothetical protein
VGGLIDGQGELLARSSTRQPLRRLRSALCHGSSTNPKRRVPNEFKRAQVPPYWLQPGERGPCSRAL